mmetsp:Transcript_21652/g.26815  ORF Transcript_21652/g.26815 Transcript_21652/m.26815 type:complete len:81 (-) Transcript_21652:21-263(-)
MRWVVAADIDGMINHVTLNNSKTGDAACDNNIIDNIVDDVGLYCLSAAAVFWRFAFDSYILSDSITTNQNILVNRTVTPQ